MPGPAALTGTRRPDRTVHTRIKNPTPTVARRNATIGAIHATLSKPPRIGAANTVAPYFAANQFRIKVSDPPPSICACSSLIMTGDTGQPTWLHSSSTCPHPHVQIISCPTLLNRDEGSAPSITTASRQTKPACIHRLIERLCVFVSRHIEGPGIFNPVSVFASRYPKASALGLSPHATKGGFSPWGMPFCCSVPKAVHLLNMINPSRRQHRLRHHNPRRRPRQIRHQRQERPHHHNQNPDPDPVHQRIQKHLDDRLIRIRIPPLIDHIQITRQRRVQRHHRRRRLARLIEPPLRRKLRNLLAAPEHIQQRILRIEVLIAVLGIGLAYHPVRPQRQRIARPHLLLVRLVERATGNANKHHHNAEVDDIPAIPPRIPPHQQHRRSQQILPRLRRNHRSPAQKLRPNRRNHTRRQRKRHQRKQRSLPVIASRPRPYANKHQHDQCHAHRNTRQNKVPPNRPQRSRPPRQQRPNPCKKQQEQSNRQIHAVIKRRAHRDLRALHILAQHRKQGPPQNRKASRQQNQVIEQEARLARHQRLQPVLRLQMVLLLEERKQTNRKHNHDEPIEPATNRQLSKRMHRAHDPRSRQQRPQNRQHKRREDQPHIPALHHPALLLHHHRVQKRRSRQPRHQGSILHRVPAPVASPAQHAIRPMRAQKNPTRQEQPRHHRPSPRNVDPLLSRIPHHQRPQRKRKRNRKSDITQVKHGRMDHHLRILQQRIQPKPIRRHRSRLNRKWRRRKVQQHQKENLYPRQNRRSKRREPHIHLMPHPQHKPIRTQQPSPQQQRPLLPRPQRRELVSRTQISISVMKNVRDRIVIRERRPHQRKRRTAQRNKTRNPSPLRRLPQLIGLPIQTRRHSTRSPQRHPTHHQRIGAQRQSQQQRKTPKLRHRVQLHEVLYPFSQGQPRTAIKHSKKAPFTGHIKQKAKEENQKTPEN